MSHLTQSQISAAMGLVDLQIEELAEMVGMHRVALGRLLNRKNPLSARSSTLEKIKDALESKGVEFLENDGVRRKPRNVEIYEGFDRFQEFSDFVYSELQKHGGDVCITAIDETLFAKYRADPEKQRTRMKELTDSGKIRMRVLATRHNETSSYAEYRKLSDGIAPPTAFYVFGNCLALVSFDQEPAPHVVVLQNSPFAAAYRISFNQMWDTAK